MGNFILTSTDPHGKRETVYLDAASSQDAYRELERKGHHDIVLHTSDSEARELVNFKDGPFKPADFLALRASSSLGRFCWLLKQIYAKTWVMLVVAVPFVALDVWRLGHLGFSGWIAILALLIPWILAAVVTLAHPFAVPGRYQRLLQAYSWGRWQKVLTLAQSLRSTLPDVTIYEACALAALGRLDEGLKRMEEYTRSSEKPRWQYLSLLSGIYDVAHLYDKALALLRLAYQEAPDNPDIKLELAYALLACEVDTSQAKHLIEAIESQHLSDLLTIVLLQTKGLYALNTRNFPEAKRLLLAAHYKVSGNSAWTDTNRAYLAIALANLQEPTEAEKQYQMARPRLVALNESRILERVERALGKR